MTDYYTREQLFETDDFGNNLLHRCIMNAGDALLESMTDETKKSAYESMQLDFHKIYESIYESLDEEEQKIYLNSQNSSGDTALFLACNNFLPDVVECLLKDSFVDPNLANHTDTTPLMIACATKPSYDLKEIRRKIVRDLLARNDINVNLNASSIDKNTALHFVCKSAFRVEGAVVHKDAELLKNALDIINMLLKKSNTDKFEINNELKIPFDILAEVYSVEEILWHVCELNCNDVLLWLIENVKKSEQIFQTFIGACNQRQMPEGINIELTPLQLACVKGNVDMVSCLLTIPHIDVNAPLAEIRLPTLSLMFNELPAEVDHAHIVDIINLLLEHEYTDVNIVDANQRTALVYAMNSRFIPLLTMSRLIERSKDFINRLGRIMYYGQQCFATPLDICLENIIFFGQRGDIVRYQYYLQIIDMLRRFDANIGPYIWRTTTVVENMPVNFDGSSSSLINESLGPCLHASSLTTSISQSCPPASSLSPAEKSEVSSSLRQEQCLASASSTSSSSAVGPSVTSLFSGPVMYRTKRDNPEASHGLEPKRACHR